MAEPVPFAGQTHNFGPARGEEHRQGRLDVLMNGSQVVSAWKFTKEELQRMLDSDQTTYVSTWTGTAVVPIFVGNKQEMNQILLDFGKETIK